MEMTDESNPPRTRRRQIVLRGVGALSLATLLALGADAALAAHRTISSSQAQSVATAIGLRHSDLPSLSQQSNPITAQERRLNAQLTTCVGGVPDSKALGEAQSPSFASSGNSSVTVNSDTEILPSASLVAKDLASITGSRGLPCLQAQLAGQLRSSISKGETLTIHGARFPSVVAGSDGTFAIRFSVVVHATSGTSTASVPLYADSIGFAYGQAEVSFSVVETGAKPSAALERRLAALLVARARAAIG
jgi:hypothetical protein